jgi:hypothetical protein
MGMSFRNEHKRYTQYSGLLATCTVSITHGWRCGGLREADRLPELNVEEVKNWGQELGGDSEDCGYKANNLQLTRREVGD